ncbi:MAG TPA: DUF3999 family protein [Candidatus Angelobacter sp.]|nr:DUF3999 family protein [Candidatus Angelobacter sp.]
MKLCMALLSVVLWAGVSLSYFKYQRPVEPAGAGQHYVVIDETVWAHARPDLGDLRFFAGETEMPYMLLIERGSLIQDREDVKVLQQASVGGKTQFLIDMSGIAEYDRVFLRLTARDFVAHARVEGQDDLHGQTWADLGDTILYDLSKEHLGSNTMLRLPRTTYRYLRVTIDGPVKPADVIGASSEVHQEEKPVWRDVAAEFKLGLPPRKTTLDGFGRGRTQPGRDTFLTFNVPDNVPVERVVFAIDPTQPNFRREVGVYDDQGRVIGSGEINRIHMTRLGRKIDSEQDEVSLSDDGTKTIVVMIANGDDPPLKITGARLQQHERRAYLETPAAGGLTLNYGDDQLESPVYDYRKLFQKDPRATRAILGPEVANTAYTGRPDERPWSDRHPALLWAAIIAAVAVLGLLALRSVKTAAAQ